MLLSPATALLAALLTSGGWQPGQEAGPAAQGPGAQMQAPPAQTQAPPPGGTAVKPPEPAKPEQGKPDEKRPPSRPPRPTRREPASAGPGTFDQSRPSRDGGPSRQEVSFAANIMGGYDDNLTAALGSGAGVSPEAMISGATAAADATLAYFRGNTLRSFRLETSGSLMGYPDNLENPAAGGSIDAVVKTPVGRSLGVSLTQRAAYEPLINVLSPGAGAGPVPPDMAPPSPTSGLFERRSWNSSSGASLDSRWGRRDTTTLGYTYRVQEFTDEDYGDNTWHDLIASHRRLLSAHVKGGVDYRYRKGEYVDSDALTRPTTEHRVEGVAEFVGAPSRRRSYSVLIAAGAGYLESVNTNGATYDSWLPTGRVRLSVNLSPTWLIDGGYQREISLFQGVTDEIYATDTASVKLAGMLSRRWSLQLGGTYSNWVTPVASGVNDRMDVYGASAGVRVLLSKSLAATAGYSYYLHRYSNPASLPEGFPAEYDRQSVRVGVTMYFPIAGSSSAPLNRW